MAERKDTPESPTMGMEHKMHSMAEGQEINEAGEEHKKHEMGLRPNEPHKTHRGRHEGHVTEDFKRRFIISLIYSYCILLSPAIGAILMSASTVIVAINARLLKM